MKALSQREQCLNALPEKHQEMLSQYREGLGLVRDAIEANYQVIQEILKTSDQIFLNDDSTYNERNGTVEKIRLHDIEKVMVVPSGGQNLNFNRFVISGPSYSQTNCA